MKRILIFLFPLFCAIGSPGYSQGGTWFRWELSGALAVQEEQFGLVNEVFLLRMQYAHLDQDLAFDRLLDRFILNQTHMQREAKMHMAYAYLRRELQEIHLKGKIYELYFYFFVFDFCLKICLKFRVNLKLLYI